IQQGIYGMLEEFAAYYYDAGASFQLYDFFAKEKLWEKEYTPYDFKHLVMGETIAFYEFRFFMANYLLYAKTKYPDIYKSLYDNKPLRVAYTLLTDKFEALLTKVKSVTDTMADDNEEYISKLLSLDFSGSDEDLVRFFSIAGYKEEDDIFKIEETIE